MRLITPLPDREVLIHDRSAAWDYIVGVVEYSYYEQLVGGYQETPDYHVRDWPHVQWMLFNTERYI